MADIFRDAIFGHVLRTLFHRRHFIYADEREGFQSPSFEEISDRNASDNDAPENDHEKASKDLSVPVVGWYSDGDTDNPLNWSTRKKSLVYAQITLLTFSVYIGSSIITPAETRLMEIFGVSAQVAALSLSIYVLGYGTGPLFFSPLSEVPIMGRNIPYMASFLCFLIVTIPAATVNNYPGFIVCRFLQGLTGGTVLATGGASATDLFGFAKVPYAMSFWSAGAFAGPALGPLIAGFAVTNSSWRWPMYELLILGVFTFILLLICLPETNPDKILLLRARRLRNLLGNPSLRSQSEIKQGEMHILRLMPRYLTTPFKITVQDPSIAFINIYTALTYGIYYSYFESFPLVYLDTYGFSVGIEGVVFLALLIACCIGAIIYLNLHYFVYEPYTIKNGVGIPESRLVPGLYAAAAAPIGIFMFGWTARESIHWVVPTIGVMIYSTSQFIIGCVIFIYLPTSYPRFAASVFAGNTFLRSALACAAIHFAQPLFRNLGIGKGCSVLASLTGGCAVVFLALWHYGPRLRARSKFAETY